MIEILVIAGGLTVGILVSYFAFKPKVGHLHNPQIDYKKILEKASHDAKRVREEITPKLEQNKERLKEIEQKHQAQKERLEKNLLNAEAKLNVKTSEIEEIKKTIFAENQKIQEIETAQKSLKEQLIPQLTKAAMFSFEQAKQQLLDELNQDLELTKEDRLRKLEEYLKEDRERIAKNLLIGIIQRYSAPTSVEKKSLLIPVVRDETRLKIIGKNAENLQYLEQELGVDIVMNDQTNTVVVSCFDLVKKHIARETIMKIMKERAATLDKLKIKLAEVRRETDRLLVEIGKKVVRDLRIERRNFPPEFLKILGRLKFRTSYGQNILKHSFEVGYFTLMLGGELGLNMDVCKIGGFFHDLGKAIDQEDGRPHDILTKEIMDKFSFPYEETHAAWTHHDAIPQETAEAMLVKAGDAISAGRPGARQETIEKYLERIHAIEAIANSYEGVDKTYSISGGRELRVLVNHKSLSDENLSELAKAIADEIQENVAYPGQIKINIIRRVKGTGVAKEKKTSVS